MSETRQLVDTVNLAIDNALANMHTCTIAKVTFVGSNTISCQPVTNRLVDGISRELPEFTEVPVVVLQGGGSYLHFPIAVDDYVLLMFTERCFDGWYNGQDFQTPLEYRMHDYSDGVAICGLNNASGLFTIPSVIQQTGDTNQDGDYTHQGTMTRVGNTHITGLLTLIGALNQTGDLSSSGKLSAATLNIASKEGVTGTFTTDDGKTVQVQNGIIWSIV